MKTKTVKKTKVREAWEILRDAIHKKEQEQGRLKADYTRSHQDIGAFIGCIE